MRLEQLIGIGADTPDKVRMKRRHEVITAVVPDFRRRRPARVEVLAGGQDLAAEGCHRGVLLRRIAFRHHDHAGNAVALCRQGNGLAVVAAGGGHHPLGHRAVPAQLLDIDQPAACLEGPGRRMVLVLHDDVDTQRPAQQGPGIGGRRRHERAHDRRRLLEVVERKQGHWQLRLSVCPALSRPDPAGFQNPDVFGARRFGRAPSPARRCYGGP